jgi:hypothetical protein
MLQQENHVGWKSPQQAWKRHIKNIEQKRISVTQIREAGMIADRAWIVHDGRCLQVLDRIPFFQHPNAEVSLLPLVNKELAISAELLGNIYSDGMCTTDEASQTFTVGRQRHVALLGGSVRFEVLQRYGSGCTIVSERIQGEPHSTGMAKVGIVVDRKYEGRSSLCKSQVPQDNIPFAMVHAEQSNTWVFLSHHIRRSILRRIVKNEHFDVRIL